MKFRMFNRLAFLGIFLLTFSSLPVKNYTSVTNPIDKVYFATASGIFVWSSDTHAVQTVSMFPAYEIEISPSGEIFVGNGGADSVASGVSTSGIFRINGFGGADMVSSLSADDLEFDENSVLYASNSDGIFRVGSGGTPVQVSTNPTSQFAFESPSRVVTTNGAAYSANFSFRTDRINLTTNTTTLLSTGGGEDIKVLPGGTIWISGQGGLFELQGPNLSPVFTGIPVFDFEVTPSGKIYIGNTAQYGGFPWPQGLYVLQPSLTPLLTTEDINSIEVVTDSDGDGVPDDRDQCSHSNLSPTVVIDGCDSGVPNTVLPTGCTIKDLIDKCAANARNHGQFVSCVAHVTNDLKSQGIITGQQKGAIQSCAAQANIP